MPLTVSSPDELFTLSELGIASIDTGSTSSTYIDPNENEHRLTGSFTWSDSTTGSMADVWFKTDPTYTIATEWLDVPPEIAALPDLQGYGTVYDLQQAMVRDVSSQLRGLVESFVAATDPVVRNGLMEQILFKWTGSDGLDPASRGGNIDARKLASLEKLYGEAFVGMDGTNPNIAAAPLLDQSYWGMFEMLYAQMMAQTHLEGLYGMISYTWDDLSQSTKGDLSAAIADLEVRLSNNLAAGEQTVQEFIRTLLGVDAKGMMNVQDFDSSPLMAINDFRWLLESSRMPAVDGTKSDDFLFGSAGADVIAGFEGNDWISAGGGDDLLYGGAGNDSLSGEDGGDTYLFGRGDGQDAIYEYSAVPGEIDTLRMDVNITPSDVTISRDGNNLILSINGTTDKMMVMDHYFSPYFQLERVSFADGTIWDTTDLTNQAQIMTGTEGADNLTGYYDMNNMISGLGGDDVLSGGPGNDILDGGSGNDTLYSGGDGSDTYIFGRGYGQDVISNYDPSSGDTDVIQMQPCIPTSDLTVSRNGDNLVLSVNGTTDMVTVEYYFAYPDYKVDQVKFADGTIWNQSDLEDKARYMTGTQGADVLTGYSDMNNVISGLGGDDVLYGVDALADTLYGGDGNDALSGGSGDDVLAGGTGNDTYVFGSGYGTDTIQENDSTGGNTDTVQLGLNPIDIVFAQTGNNLDLMIHGSADKLTLQSWYSGSAYQEEVFTAADGRHLLNTQVSQLIQAMATFVSSNGLANWDQAISERPQDVQALLAQYWTP